MKTNTIFIFIFSLTLFLTTGALAWYVRQSIDQKIEVVREHHLKEEKNKNLEFGNQLRSNIELLNLQEEKIKKSFLNSNEIVTFITQIESEAQSRGLEVEVEKVEYGTSESLQKYIVQPITLSVQFIGQYSQIESYLKSLTLSGKSLVIKELRLYETGDIESSYTARIIIEGILLSYE